MYCYAIFQQFQAAMSCYTHSWWSALSVGQFKFHFPVPKFKTKETIAVLNQGNLIKGKAQLVLKNWKNRFGDQREDSLTCLGVCYLQ